MTMNMSVQACQRCAKLFRHVRSPFCPECLDLIDSEFKTVSDYIAEHRRTTIAQTSAETGVPEKSILYLIREERLSFGEAGPTLQCERCNTFIPEGRFCSKCVGGLRTEFFSMDPNKADEPQKAGESLSEDIYNGMHTRFKRKLP